MPTARYIAVVQSGSKHLDVPQIIGVDISSHMLPDELPDNFEPQVIAFLLHPLDFGPVSVEMRTCNIRASGKS